MVGHSRPNEREHTSAAVELLMTRGTKPGFPHFSGVPGSRHSLLCQLRIQIGGKPIRISHAFDPGRSVILLIGGDKTGDARFYKQCIPVADSLCDIYLQEPDRKDSSHDRTKQLLRPDPQLRA